MISVAEAEKIISLHARVSPVISRLLSESYGEVLREDIFADRPQPSFNKVLMDGIALRFDTWRNGIRIFKIQGIQPSGTKSLRLKNPEFCIEVMTGGVLPTGCDCVIPVEHITTQDKKVYIDDSLKIQQMQNILPKALDYKAGEKLLSKGIILSPGCIAVVTSVGKKNIKISLRPKVAIISTGDELVDVGQPLKYYQIRTSNSYALTCALKKYGFKEVKIFHLKDDRKQMLVKIKSIIKNFDVIILSGGVSMGKFDYVPGVLSDLGVKVQIHKVSQKPGKPFWFGVKKRGPIVFALPGNPASTLVCFYRYVLPYLFKSLGVLSISKEYAVLSKEVQVPTSLTSFVPVKVISSTLGISIATPIATSGSGDYLALANSDGFVELPAQKGNFSKNSSVQLYRW